MLFVCYPRCSTCARAREWLAGRGVELEARRFTPHVTLARRVPALGEAPALFASPAAERVEAISLMRSQLEFRPPRYTELHRTLLRKR